MGNLSIFLPAYVEPFLNNTISSLIEGTSSTTEIIPILDGYLPEEPLIKHPRVKPIYLKENKGHRNAINEGIRASSGDYIMKLDAHCTVKPGFDAEFLDNMQDNWLVIPRRYYVNPRNWETSLGGTYWDYHYLCFPNVGKYGLYMGPGPMRKKGPDIDNTMSFQGSGWIAKKDYFVEHIYPMDDDEDTYGKWCADQLEIGLKYWLGGGEIKVNKNIWYGHMNKRPHQYKKGMFSRFYKRNPSVKRYNEWAVKHWMNDKEPGMKPISWLVEKFWPVPSWPEDWKEQWASLERKIDERNTVM